MHPFCGFWVNDETYYPPDQKDESQSKSQNQRSVDQGNYQRFLPLPREVTWYRVSGYSRRKGRAMKRCNLPKSKYRIARPGPSLSTSEKNVALQDLTPSRPICLDPDRFKKRGRAISGPARQESQTSLNLPAVFGAGSTRAPVRTCRPFIHKVEGWAERIRSGSQPLNAVNGHLDTSNC